MENKRYRINGFIRAPQVRLIDFDGSQVGIVALSEALSKAQAKDLDLVEISAQADPPVCKIVNFSKFRYEIEKKEKEAKKKQKVAHLKEIRIRPNIAEHDLEVKIKRARGFIADGDKVQLTAVFAGRQIQHKELGLNIVDKVRESLSDIAEQEGKQTSIGTRFFMTLIPKRKGSK